MTEQRIEYPCPVRRLHVVWRGGEWSIAGETRVPSMTLPASDDLPEADKISGFWWEVVDGEGRAIHRHVLHDPFARSMERFDDGGLITRMAPMDPMEPEEVGFDVLVPDVADAAAVHLYSSNPPGGSEPGSRGAACIAAIDVPPTEGGDDGYR